MNSPDGPSSATAIRSFRLGISASVSEGLGAAITWAGLPLYVATITSDPRQLAWLFTAQTLAGLVMSLFAGNLTDRFSATVLIVSSSVFIAALLVAVFFFFGEQDILPYYALGILNAVASSIASNAQRVWLGSLAPQQDLAKWLGKRGVWLSSTKLIGTALGPIIYLGIGKYALLLSALFILIGGLLYFVAVRRSETPHATNLRARGGFARIVAGWSEVRSNPILLKMLFVQAGVALLGIPLTVLLLELLFTLVDGDSPYFSAFWAIGFLGSILANGVLATGVLSRIAPKRLLIVGFVLAAGFIASMALSGQPILFLALFVFVVFNRTILGVTVFATIFPTISRENRGRVLGVGDFLTDGLALVALLILSTLPAQHLIPFAFVYLGLVLSVFLIGALRLPKAVGRMYTEVKTHSDV